MLGQTVGEGEGKGDMNYLRQREIIRQFGRIIVGRSAALQFVIKMRLGR